MPWSSKQQTKVSRSSAEAKYRVVAHVVAECWWLRQLLQDLHVPDPQHGANTRAGDAPPRSSAPAIAPGVQDLATPRFLPRWITHVA